MIKPFLKWAGGKTQLLDELDKNLPLPLKDGLKEFTYIEPFLGGGAVLFMMLRKYPNLSKIIVNDSNKDLINAYKEIQLHPRRIVLRLEKLARAYNRLNVNERKDFYLNRRNDYNKLLSGDPQKSALLVFLNKTCYNGLYRVNKSGLFNVPSGTCVDDFIVDKETIYDDSKALKNVLFYSVNFEELEIPLNANNLFVYFDPPYRPLSKTSYFNSYSKSEFNDESQRSLRDFAFEIDKKGGYFMESNSDSFLPEIGEEADISINFFDKIFKHETHFSKIEILRVYARRNINATVEGRGKIKELLIKNF